MEVLVTGCDTDLGRTIAERFRDDGHRVVIAGARRDDPRSPPRSSTSTPSFSTTPLRPASKGPAHCSRTTSTPS